MSVEGARSLNLPPVSTQETEGGGPSPSDGGGGATGGAGGGAVFQTGSAGLQSHVLHTVD